MIRLSKRFEDGSPCSNRKWECKWFRQSAGGRSHIAVANHVEHLDGVVIKVEVVIGCSAFGLSSVAVLARYEVVVVDCSHVTLSAATYF